MTANQWAAWIAQALAFLIGGGGLVKLLEALLRRRTVKADATETLATSVTDWAEDLKKEAKEARDRADVINERLDSAQDKVRTLTDQVHHLTYELNVAFATLGRWKAAIADLRMSREQLMAMVDVDFPTNPNGQKGT